MADAQALRTVEAFPLRAVSLARPRGSARRLGLQGTWAVAFIIPYAAVFLAFVAYPVFYGLWLGRDPALYAESKRRRAALHPRSSIQVTPPGGVFPARSVRAYDGQTAPLAVWLRKLGAFKTADPSSLINSNKGPFSNGVPACLAFNLT